MAVLLSVALTGDIRIVDFFLVQVQNPPALHTSPRFDEQALEASLVQAYALPLERASKNLSISVRKVEGLASKSTLFPINEMMQSPSLVRGLATTLNSFNWLASVSRWLNRRGGQSSLLGIAESLVLRVITDRSDGALKKLGIREADDEQALADLSDRQVLFESAAVDVSAHEEDGASLKLLFAELPTGIQAYHFITSDGTLIVVVNELSASEEISREAIYHEVREAYWFSQGFGQHEAHILASAEQALQFGSSEALTPYHQAQLTSMTADQLLALTKETEQERQRHHDLLRRMGFDVPQVTAYEKRLRERASQILQQFLLDKLTSNPEADKALRMRVVGNPSGEITDDTVQKWLENLEVLSVEWVAEPSNSGIDKVLYRLRDGKGRIFYILGVQVDGRLEFAAFAYEDPMGRKPFYGNALYLQLPTKFLPNISARLKSFNIKPSPKTTKELWFLGTPWLETPAEAKQLIETLDGRPAVKSFLLHWLGRGIKPRLTGRAVVEIKAYDAMHRKDGIYRNRFRTRATNVEAFIHEFIHELFNHLTDDQKRSINEYFKAHHPEFMVIFEKAGAYEGLENHSNYENEALAYYLTRALFGPDGAMHRGWGDSNISFQLHDADLQFFTSIGVLPKIIADQIRGAYGWPRSKGNDPPTPGDDQGGDIQPPGPSLPPNPVAGMLHRGQHQKSERLRTRILRMLLTNA